MHQGNGTFNELVFGEEDDQRNRPLLRELAVPLSSVHDACQVTALMRRKFASHLRSPPVGARRLKRNFPEIVLNLRPRKGRKLPGLSARSLA